MAENQNKLTVSTATTGMNRDSIPSQIKEGEILYALNCLIENFDGNSITYQNDSANVECITNFPAGFKVVGVKAIPEISRVLFWLANPSTEESQIGYSDNGECSYTTLITDEGQDCKLGFSVDYPILKAIIKTTNCSTQVYWAQAGAPRRFIDFDDLPWKEISDPNNDYKKIKVVGSLDCNKLNVQPNFSVPTIKPVEVAIGGSLIEGTYQFSVAYSNANGDTYTSYYNVSNPIAIYEDSIGENFNNKTSKAIEINILDIDTTGLYEYFNIAVVKTVNDITSVELAFTVPTSAATLTPDGRTSYRYVYTGGEVSPITLDIKDIFIRFPYYDYAEDVFEVDNVLGWSILKADDTLNYQPIWSKVKMQWETYKIPYNTSEGYYNGINTALYKGYMRDEVYALEGCFILKNGKETKSFHIPGRAPLPYDLTLVGVDNKDNITFSETENKCKDPIERKNWEVYNTGFVIDKTQEYKDYIAANPPVTTTTPNLGATITGNIHITCPNNGSPANPCDQEATQILFTFSSATPAGGITLQLAFVGSTGSMGWDIGYTPSGATSSYYGSSPFVINIPGGVTSFTAPALSIRNAVATWVCLPCSNNIYTLYAKVLCNTANFTVSSFQSTPIAIQNIQDICSTTTTTVTKDGCYVGPYEYGEFAYWESGDTYPNNIDIWGDLRSKPIRHHKFPDYLVSPIHTQNTSDSNNSDYKDFEYAIFPIGIRLDINSLHDAIQSSNLTQEQKDSIVGFKIFRGNRATNKSVIAKGILHNVGKSTYDGKDQYYANYPYNDLSADDYYFKDKFYRFTANTNPFVSQLSNDDNNRLPLGYSSQFDPFKLEGFNNTEAKERFVFHSPDTSFFQPSLTNTGSFLKLDAAIYGKSFGHFVKVEDNAEYKFLTRDTIIASVGVALISGITAGVGTFGTPSFTIANAGAVYTAWSEIFEKLVPFDNFGYTHNSIGVYGNYEPILNTQEKQRNIDYVQYVTDGANTIEDGNTLNNFRREGSVYLKTRESLLYPHEYGAPTDDSRYTLASLNDGQAPETVREKDISSYYGAIKQYLPRQWGRLYSYETIDTGYYQPLEINGTKQIKVPAIFGGDIFINRFAYKSKLSLFRRTTVGAQNQTDIAYNDIGNLNYPIFWISTKPLSFDVDYTDEVEKVLNQIEGTSGTVIANILSGGGLAISRANNLIVAILKDVYNKTGIKNINLDRWDLDSSKQSTGLSERGLMYLFVYGIPYYFCESEVNVDYRQATNELEGMFFPKVSNDIPDDWLQEIRVPIINDNNYTYNRTYSKQNKESFVDHLKEDFDPTKLCVTEFPNRAIWSDKSSQEEVKNNWLIYRPSAYFDFPKSSGPLISLDKIQNIEVLARFENKTQKYNALTTVQVSEGPQGYLGNPSLFSGTPPIDIAETDNGYAGSQNKFLLRTEFGQIFIDAKRGQVILLSSKGTQTISNLGMSKWFAENLPFTVLEYDSTFPIDNHLNSVGISGVYDQFYQRVLITKKDYQPKDFVILFGGKAYYDPAFTDNKTTRPFFTENTIEVPIGDPTYFINKSWTISYCFKTNSWISFHSFTPSYYVAYPTYFQTGRNDLETLWNHNKTNTSFQTYYGTQYPFILEYPFVYKLQDEILQSVKSYCNTRVYENFDTFYEPNDILFFNKVIVYNNQQCSGIRNLIPKPKNNLSTYLSYPKYNTDSIDILLSKTDNLFIFNGLWDISQDKSKPIFLSTESFIEEDKQLNQDNMNYTNTPQTSKKAPLRAKEAYVRFILDNANNFKLLTRFSISQTTPSYS